jgi:hypothetical protein
MNAVRRSFKPEGLKWFLKLKAFHPQTKPEGLT